MLTGEKIQIHAARLVAWFYLKHFRLVQFLPLKLTVDVCVAVHTHLVGVVKDWSSDQACRCIHSQSIDLWTYGAYHESIFMRYRQHSCTKSVNDTKVIYHITAVILEYWNVAVPLISWVHSHCACRHINKQDSLHILF